MASLFSERHWFPFNLSDLLAAMGPALAEAAADCRTLLGTLATTAGATPTDFRFKGVALHSVTATFAVMGKFNVLVGPDIGAMLVDYNRSQIEPVDALGEVAKLTGNALMKVPDSSPPLYLITKAPLTPDLKPPLTRLSGTPTDFNFKEVQFRNIAQTIAVLGRFDAMVPHAAGITTAKASLKQVLPTDAMYWIATVAGFIVEYNES